MHRRGRQHVRPDAKRTVQNGAGREFVPLPTGVGEEEAQGALPKGRGSPHVAPGRQTLRPEDHLGAGAAQQGERALSAARLRD